MPFFCDVKLGCRLNVHVLHILAKQPRCCLLCRVQVPDGRSILTRRWIGVSQFSPLLQNLFISDNRWTIFDKDSFCVVHHAVIGWILLYPSRVANNAAQNAIHRLKFGLRAPKSSTRDDGNLMVESWYQDKFGTG
jgi:hypothetical protein